MADIYRYRGSEVATLQVEISILTIREVCVYGFDASVLTTRVLVARTEQAAFEGVGSGTNIFLRIGITAYGGAINPGRCDSTKDHARDIMLARVNSFFPDQ